jgi:hypothetical protein
VPHDAALWIAIQTNRRLEEGLVRINETFVGKCEVSSILAASNILQEQMSLLSIARVCLEEATQHPLTSKCPAPKFNVAENIL